MDTSASIWQGERVRLRAIEPSDWEAYFAWNQDDEQARGVSSIPFPQSAEAVRQWAQQEATRKPEGDAFRFVIENETGEVVGDLTTHHCDARVGSFSYGITIRREHRRNGYAAEAIALVLRYYFRELRYQKATVSVYSFKRPPRASTRSSASSWKAASGAPVFTDGSTARRAHLRHHGGRVRRDDG